MHVVQLERLFYQAQNSPMLIPEDDVLTRSPPGTRTAARAVLTDRSVSLVTRALVKRIDLEGGEDGEAAKRLVQLEMTDGGPAQVGFVSLILSSPQVSSTRESLWLMLVMVIVVHDE